jgi:hypothetical protein
MGTKVKLPKELHEKARKLAELAGYSSVDEFVIHVLEKETEKLESAGDEDEIKKRLKGLGYIS